MTNDVHHAVDEQLRRTRQRYTRGRRQLVDLLLETARPVTITELHDLGAAQSLSSLYRNLAILEQCGAVHRISSTDDVARFELTEEHSEHHHHMMCSTCGRIEDVQLPGAVEQELTRAAALANRDHGFAVESHRVEFVGMCRRCA